MNIVVSQSMYFPWVGMLEQLRLADVFVHYDDVQYSKGSFTNRVQIKKPDGTTAWMTVPLRDLALGQRICDVQLQPPQDWVSRHLGLLATSFAHAPHAQDALQVAHAVLARPHATIAELARASLLAMADYLGLASGTRFVDSAALDIPGASSQRVLDIVKALGGTRYITGHGARQYLDHALFERAGVEVAYMDYRRAPYPQRHGAFTPYVSALDLIAHQGKAGVDWVASDAIDWKDFGNGPT